MLLKGASDRIHIINIGMCYPTRERQPPLCKYEETMHSDTSEVLFFLMVALYRTVSLQSPLSVLLVFRSVSYFFFSAVCSTQQAQFCLLSINLRVSSDGNKSNSGTFCWRTGLVQMTSTSPLHLWQVIRAPERVFSNPVWFINPPEIVWFSH